MIAQSSILPVVPLGQARWPQGLARLMTGTVLVVSAGCSSMPGLGSQARVTTPEGKGIAAAQAEAYDGPKARLAVSQFRDRTGKGWWTGAIGDGMADMLATALFHSDRFVVLERQAIGDVLREQDLGSAGRVAPGTAAPVGEIEGAELLVTGAVTEFEADAAGGRAGLGFLRTLGGYFGVGGAVGGMVAGAVVGGISRAHMAIDVRVIDTRTSRILAATTVEGEAADFDVGSALAGAGGGGALAGALGVWSKTPVEKALRLCIQAAVNAIVAETPAVYFRHR